MERIATMRRSAACSRRSLLSSLLALLVAPAFALLAVQAGAQSEARPRLGLMSFTYLDTSGEPAASDHEARLATLAATITSELQPHYDVVPVAGAERCAEGDSDCLLQAARAAGADLVLAGAVHKTSTLISQIWVGVFDVATGKRLFYRDLSFRGDDDEAFRRAGRFLSGQVAKAALKPAP
jgi:hypothetical protein